MNYKYILLSLHVVIGLVAGVPVYALPPITGTPEIDSPPILAWPTDRGNIQPNLNDNTANTVHDLHAQIDSCDLMLSTEGNYHPALQDIWPVYLAKFKDAPLQNWVYSTSPPVVAQQLANRQLQFGNIYSGCRPSVAVANLQVIELLQRDGHTDGQEMPLYKDRGSVILVKRGNPKKIHSVWDLGRIDVHVVTPNPEREKGAFNTYAETIFGIASKDQKAHEGKNAETLFNNIYNGERGKWLAGERIHHRNTPWSVAYGRADATVIYSHLARYIKATFPDLFDIIPLGGTVENPLPLPGSQIGVRYLVRIKGDWNQRQLEAREKLIETLLSDEFTEVLKRRGLARASVVNSSKKL